MWPVFAVAFFAYAGLLSFAARRNARFLEPKSVQLIAVGGFFGLLYPVAQAVGPLLVLPVAFAGFVLGVPFLVFLVGEWFDGAARSLRGVSSMKVRPTYDLAEKAEREARVDDALDLYREQGALHAADPEPRRRIGELLLSKGERAAAIDAFRAALALIEEPEPYATLAFRIADLEGPEEARRLLEDVVRRFPGSRFEGHARTRLAAQGPCR